MKLKVDPFVDAHRGYALHIARPGSERETVEHVYGSLLLVHVREVRDGFSFGEREVDRGDSDQR